MLEQLASAHDQSQLVRRIVSRSRSSVSAASSSPCGGSGFSSTTRTSSARPNAPRSAALDRIDTRAWVFYALECFPSIRSQWNESGKGASEAESVDEDQSDEAPPANSPRVRTRESGPALLLGRSFVWFARVSEAVTTSTLSADVVAARANICRSSHDPESGPHESRWYSCGISVAATAAACAGSGALPILIVGCGAGIWTSACKCLQAAHPDDPAVWQGPCENL